MLRNGEMLRNGACQQVQPESDKFILSRQKGWTPQTYIKPHVPKRFIPEHHFKMEGDVFNKGSSSGKQFSNKNRSKTCLFWYSYKQNIKEIYSFPMGGELTSSYGFY